MQTEKEYIIGREINTLRCESTGEYSLPDYNGDVKKVLTVKTRAFPTGKFVGDDMLEFSGTVGYEVVYLDSENNLTHAEFSTDYEAALRINSDTYCGADIKTSVSGCNVRLVGPRKFSVKSTLDSDVRLSERRVYSVGGDAFMEYEPETLTGTVRVFSSGFAEGEISEISEELIAIDGAIADEVEILTCDVIADVGAVYDGGDATTVKGSLGLSILYKNGESLPQSVSKDIPYSAELTLDGFEDGDFLDARVDVIAIKGVVTPTESGVSLATELRVIPRLYAKKNLDIDLVTDAYVKERGSDNEYSDFGYTEYVCTEKCESLFSGEHHLTDGDFDKIDAIIHSDAAVRVDSCEIADSVAKISGEIRFSAIACRVLENEEYNYSPIRFAQPFEQNVNINCQICGNMHLNPTVKACNVKIEPTENGVSVACTLSSEVSVFSDKRERSLIASYLTDEEFSKDESVFTVYYPDASESLFDIAKRFHTSVRSVAEMNRLSEAVFASPESSVMAGGIKKLLIK